MRLYSKIKVLANQAIFPVLAAVTMIGAWMPPAADSQNLVANGSFEQPGSVGDAYTVNFTGMLPTNYVTGWLLGLSAVASGNGSAYDGICGGNGFTGGNYENGTNCIFLQGGSASTTVTLTAGSYTLSFWAMGRTDAGNGANPVAVSVGTIFTNTVTPNNTSESQPGDWINYLMNFTAPSDGVCALVFQSTIPYGPSGDHMTFIDNVSIMATSANFVVNGSFEQPGVVGSRYTVPFGSLATNAVPGWAFGLSTGTAPGAYDGLVSNNGGLNDGNVEDGTNAAFLQGGSMSQNVTLNAGTYSLSFWAMGRSDTGTANPVAVSLGNLLSQTVTPNNTAENTLGDWQNSVYYFNVPSNGTYALAFQAMLLYNPPSDHTTFIDNVSIMTVSAIPPPTIISEPGPQLVFFAGQSAQFTVQTGSAPPVYYQWQVETNGAYVDLNNGGRFSGATNATLIISNLMIGDSANYQVRLTNAGGSTNSTVAALTVLPVPPPGSPRYTVTVINPSFEDSQQTNDVYTTGYGTLNPQTGVPGWQFSSSGGDSYAGLVTESGATLGTPKYIPQCWQAAFIQGTGQFSQLVTFQAGGTNLIRFQAKGRSSAGAGAEPIAVSVDGNLVGTFIPATTRWSLYTSLPFNVTSGVHVVTFAGTIPVSVSDRTSFIDGVEIASLAEAAALAPPNSPVYDIVFVGDSITYGATLADPATQASAVRCMQSLGTRFNMAVRMSNQGVSGTTTVDWLPSTDTYFPNAVAAAATLESNDPGQLIFTIMLGANDSAQSGPNGSPVSAANYERNLQLMINQFLTDYPAAFIFVHYPTWYSTNTHNGALYGPAGAALLKTYMPQIDLLVASNTVLHPGHVFAGDKLAYGYFETNYLTLLTPESGVDGTFYLHPNAAGAVVLGGFWANAIVAPLNVTPNDPYVAWLQSSDLTPGTLGTGFSNTPTNSLVSNGVSYGDPGGLIPTLASNFTSLGISANVRNDTNLTVVLEDSTNLVNWSPFSWPVSSNQSNVATGFIRHTVQVPINSLPDENFYRLMLQYSSTY